ncbi:glycosyltransferase [Leuconostoc mesenteroides]|uniref:glycosyltransferase n=1 Tax=Leuconostoc mesenteroides TaxID=1245 RepID=UPI000FFE0002|nr:glycosyltransferase [Leuconostoc mesenteroides]QAT27935.1 glycosyltransferase [Leuconostoc mesenteroides]
MKRKKVKVMIITQSEGGGLRRHLVDLLNHLDKDIFEIYFVYNSRKGDDTFQNWLKNVCEGINLIDLPNFERQISLKNDLSIFLELRKLVKDISPDVVHTHSSKAGVLGRIAAKTLGVKKIFYTPHAYSFLSSEFSIKKRNLYKVIERFLSRYATTKTFNVSNSEKESAINAKIDFPEKFEVITNSLPEVELLEKKVARDKLKIDQEQVAVVNLARVTYQKNPELFVNIATEFLSLNTHVHFYWIGAGDFLNPVPSNVHFLGNINDADLYLKAFDIYLSTSLYEGLSYSLLEAARAHLPIVATEVSGNIDMRDIYKKTYYFKVDDEQMAVKLIQNISTNDNSKYNGVLNKNKDFDNLINTIQGFYLN